MSVPLAAHSNVYDVAIGLMLQRRYRVRAELDASERLDWTAERDDFRFVASNPVELLGLVAMHILLAPEEAKTGWWWAGKEPRHVARLREEAVKEAAPMLALVRDADGPERVRMALDEAGGVREEAARTLGIAKDQLIAIFADPRFSSIEDDD